MALHDDVDFSALVALSPDEVVTHSFVNDVRLRSGKLLALVTLDNGRDYTRPTTLGPGSLYELDAVLAEQEQRALRGEIDAVAITGKPFFLAAGADLTRVSDLQTREQARMMGQLGHRALGRLGDMTVPTFCFINGLALGGGLEVALNANYRTINETAPAIALPEVFLGLVPGWGGAYIVPNLIGIRRALKVIIENPLKNNRVLKPQEALELGLADVAFPSARFLENSLVWADDVINGKKVQRPAQPGWFERTFIWNKAISIARSSLVKKIGTVPLSPYRALDLMQAARTGSRDDAFLREDDALTDLISGPQFQASMYAFNLVQKHAKKPTGAPDAKLAQRVSKVGIIGAGLMARQFALLFVRKLRVPVVLTDIDQSRLDDAVTYVRTEIESLRAKGRLTPDEAARLRTLISGTTDRNAFADADWIIEAVFEELQVKQHVFAEIEPIAPEHAIFATNTSSLSVGAIGALMKDPSRLVGFHFFNPVAVMPLIEVVRAHGSADAAIATALAVAKRLGKTAVITSDSPGFVVNRLLAKVLGESMHAVDTGTPFDIVDAGVQPFGMPMPPFVLLDLVGLKVGAHVLDTHHQAFPDRFFASDNLHKLAESGVLIRKDKNGNFAGYDPLAVTICSGGTSPISAEEFRLRIENGLADEIQRMLDEGVVGTVEDIDLCMIMGAGWPFQMGGITPYLDRVGASERAVGHTFHDPAMRGLPA